MFKIRQFVCEKRRRLCLLQHTPLIAALVIGVGCLLDVDIASAAEAAASQVSTKYIPLAKVFTFLFLMLGPFKIIGPFSKVTRGADAQLTRKIALLAILFSSIALLVAGFLGEMILSSYSIPVPVLALSAGIILFLVALQNMLLQFKPPASHSKAPAGSHPTPSLNMAMTPLAFPTVVTPYGIAAVVVFIALSPDLQSRLSIGAIVLVLMLLNLIVMLLTRHIGSVMSAFLAILGAVLGVIQVALGLEIIHNSLGALGIL